MIDRSLVLTGKWDILYDEIRQMRLACGEAHMKAILATGELTNLTNVINIFTLATSNFYYIYLGI